MPSQNIFKSKLRVESQLVQNVSDIKSCWERLEKYSSSIFLSWAWIGPWLATIKNETAIYSLYFINKENSVVGLAFITQTRIHRRKFFNINQLSLNESEKKGTKFIIEYNSILHTPEYREAVYYSFIDFLANSTIKFDEIKLNAIDMQNTPDIKALCDKFKLHHIEEETSKAWYADLAQFKNNPDSYPGSLSKNKREQIRRSIKYFLQYGEEEVKFAANKDEALEFFDQLGLLHQKYWTEKGLSGSFANKKWVTFHKTLIRDFFKNVQLIRISYGNHLVGYLYNLIDDGIAYSMQSGFNYSTDKNDRPGIVSHYLITRHYITCSVQKYEYLAGELQYKKSLSTDFNHLGWNIIQKKSVKMRIENFFVWLARLIR